MADSDSSTGEDDGYTETNVLLGYASKEASDDTISHLGGRPDWLDPSISPSAALVKCKVCNDLMVLILQLNGDLPEFFPGHERRLYILSCRRKTCRRKEGSVRALRGVRVSEIIEDKENRKVEPRLKAQSSKTPVNVGETLFGTNPLSTASSPNPFSTSKSTLIPSNPFSTSSSTSSNPFAASQSTTQTSSTTSQPPKNPPDSTELPKTFASALTLNSPPSIPLGPQPPHEPWPEESSFPPAYPLYYLVDADYEILEKVNDIAIPTTTMDLDEASSNGGSQKEDKNVYESTIDKTFQKFADRLAQNPEQVIRYEFRGQPLLYSKHDAVGRIFGGGKEDGNVKVGNRGGGKIPICANCGTRRVFEVQLTPHAIMELESEEVGLDGMEWGTIIVGVCEKDCRPRFVDSRVAYLEEWVGVQWEEMSERR